MGRQAGDFLAYILLPLCCVVLPYAVGQALIRDISKRAWLLKARSAAALDSARHYVGFRWVGCHAGVWLS
jgi:hypothetical protein